LSLEEVEALGLELVGKSAVQPLRGATRFFHLSIYTSLALHVPRYFLADGRADMVEYLRNRSLPLTAAAIEALTHNRNTKWPLQRMPTISHVMADLTILRRAAHLLGEPVYIFGDDIKDYFNHLDNAPEELWKCVISFLGDAQDELHRVRPSPASQPDAIFVSERRMGFGLHLNSNVAQQLSEAINDLFREDVDHIEDLILVSDERPVRHSVGSPRDGCFRNE
jgi:hypothetical protein